MQRIKNYGSFLQAYALKKIIESFVDKFKEVENGAPEIHNHYRYNMAFESARILGDFIKSDEIAQYS